MCRRARRVQRGARAKPVRPQTVPVPKARPAAGSRVRGAPRPRPPAEPIEHATAQMRAVAGKAARREAPRSAQAEYAPAPDRADPVDLLEQQSATRVPE